MNEETTKKIYRKKTREEQEKKQESYSDKLKTEKDKRAYVGGKLRTGKADLTETREEKALSKQLKKQGRTSAIRKTYEIAVIAKNTTGKAVSSDNTQDNNEDVTGQIAYVIGEASLNTLNKTQNRYSNKLHKKKSPSEKSSDNEKKSAADGKLFQRGEKNVKAGDVLSNTKSKEQQKLYQKKKIQKEGYRKTNGVGEKIKEFFEKGLEKVYMAVAENPMAVVFAVLFLLIALLICASASSCSLFGTGSGDTLIATSFTAEDEDILAVDADYTEKEEKLLEYIEEFETQNPGYDEYSYIVDEIGHNPFELAALLTVLHENYTEREVLSMLDIIYDSQYAITTTQTSETRYKAVVNEETGQEETVEYEYRTLTLTVTNSGIDEVARNIGLSDDELARYELLLETYGNKKYLFENDIYAIKDKGPYDDYKIPSEYLTDEEFARLIREAEKYLGDDYVWGGSNPDEGFDCSGFVSYVINHSGNGWNVGRPTANGLVNQCTKISGNNAKPGDLVFFKNTYSGAPSGASHVGIYVGNGMMIHCGNPIQYTSIETPFWQNHLYTYGRLDH